MIRNKHHSHLGYAPIIAASAAGGPPGLVIGSAIALGLSILSMINFGSGRKEADAIVPVANALVNPQRTGDLDKIVDAIARTEDVGELQQIGKDLLWLTNKYDAFLSNPDFKDGRAVSQARADMFPLIARIMTGLISKISALQGETVIYRLLIWSERGDGSIESGATYQACSRTNPAGCDPQTFPNEAAARAYAAAHNEIVAWVTSAEDAWKSVETLKDKPLNTAPILVMPPASVPPVAPQNIAPSITPPPMGMPTGGLIAPETPGERQFVQGTIYRLLIMSERRDGSVESGATYAGCSRSNPTGCQPLTFANMDDALFYCSEHNEIPVAVASADDAWDIVDGKKTVDPNMILSTAGISTPLLLVGVAAAVLVLPKLLKKRG